MTTTTPTNHTKLVTWVQESREPIENVARVTGFSDPERMRRAFIRAFGQPPQSLRRAARELAATALQNA